MLPALTVFSAPHADSQSHRFDAGPTVVDAPFPAGPTAPEAPRFVGSGAGPRRDLPAWLERVARAADPPAALRRLDALKADAAVRRAAARHLAAVIDDPAHTTTTALFALAAVGRLGADEARPTLETLCRRARARLQRADALPEPEEHLALAVLQHLEAPAGDFEAADVYAAYADLPTDDAAQACQRYRGALDAALGEDRPARSVHRRGRRPEAPVAEIPWAFDDTPGWSPAPSAQVRAAPAAEGALWSQARRVAHRRADDTQRAEARLWSQARRAARRRAEAPSAARPTDGLSVILRPPSVVVAVARRTPWVVPVAATVAALLAVTAGGVAVKAGAGALVPAAAWLMAAAGLASGRGPGWWLGVIGHGLGALSAFALATADVAWPPGAAWVLLGLVGMACTAGLVRPDVRRWFRAHDRRGLPRLHAPRAVRPISGWR